jgi:hypothetical protein
MQAEERKKDAASRTAGQQNSPNAESSMRAASQRLIRLFTEPAFPNHLNFDAFLEASIPKKEARRRTAGGALR